MSELAPVPAPPATERQDLPPPPRGIRGWLLFFCVTTVLAPLLPIINLSIFGVNEDTLISFGVGLFMAFTGGMVWAKSKYALLLVYIMLALILVFAIGDLVYVSGSSTRGQEMFYDMTEGSKRNIFYVLIWTLYFLLSQRVRNTFGSNFPFFPTQKSSK